MLCLAPEEGLGVRDQRDARASTSTRSTGSAASERDEPRLRAVPPGGPGTLTAPDTLTRSPVCEDERHDRPPPRPARRCTTARTRSTWCCGGTTADQVAETIERLEADFRIALADRDAAVARSADLASQLSALHGEIESLRRKAASAAAPTFENISERIQHMLQLAEEEAGGDPPRRRAADAAGGAASRPPAEERALLERHAAGQAEVERMLAEARQNAEQIAQKAQMRADELVAKAQERVARLDAESQARRAKVEEDFEIAQRARRAEAARVEEERERVSTEAARAAGRRRRAARRPAGRRGGGARPRRSATSATS